MSDRSLCYLASGKPVVVQNLEQLGLFESGNRLSRLIVIDQNDLEARRVEQVTLACNTGIESSLVDHPVFVDFVAQNAVEKIADLRLRIGESDLPGSVV